jgi:hypothetical protein
MDKRKYDLRRRLYGKQLVLFSVRDFLAECLGPVEYRDVRTRSHERADNSVSNPTRPKLAARDGKGTESL